MAVATPINPRGSDPAQIGILVADLDAAMRAARDVAGLSPWMVYEMSAAAARTWEYRGRPGTFSMLAALHGESPQVELVQALTGPSIYDEWITDHGHGLHHIAFLVDDLAVSVADMGGAGFPVIQQGRGHGLAGDGGHAYFDTLESLGILVEAIERPVDRRPPDRWWPAEPAQPPRKG
jgi:methylmalonyl-CoA/ethylmalonyl-CoA epimerase